MLRVSKNAWWTSILTLWLCLALSSASHSPAFAFDPQYTGGDDVASGDPDLPDTAQKGAYIRVRGALEHQPRAEYLSMRTAGDGRISTRNVTMDRLWVVWLSLRSLYFRF